MATVTASSSDSALVGRHTAHYLDVVERYKSEPMRSYHFHHLMVNYEIIGPFDAAKFKSAAFKLAATHPAFRSSFRRDASGWIQSIANEPDPRMFRHVVFGAEIVDWRQKTQECIIAENDRPFDVFSEPLITFTLLEFPGKAAFMTKFHHIVCDGWGILVALSQLLALYEAEVNGTTAPGTSLPPSALLDAATRENAWLESPDGTAQLNWWRNHIGDHAFIANPMQERPQGFLGLRQDHLSLEVSAALFKIAEQSGVHFSYLIHAAFTKALQTWTGSPDILVTFVKANRNDANAGIVGNFADWVPVRHRLNLDASLPQIAKDAQKDVAESKDHFMPYWHLVRELCPSQYFNDFGMTPYSFDYMPELNPNIDYGGKSSFVLLRDLEVFPFRLTATDIFCRTTPVGQIGTPERRIEIFLIFHSGFLAGEKVQAVLDEMKAELEKAARG